jgi:sugar lactone lactonase YvrE
MPELPLGYDLMPSRAVRTGGVVTLKRQVLTFLVLLYSCAIFSKPALAQKHVFTVVGGVVRDGHAATNTALHTPRFAAYDKKGNLYIADRLAHRIRKVNANGVISTLAGDGISGYGGDGGPAKSARVSFPAGLIVDKHGNIIFSDSHNARVRKIDTSGIITTIAGNGTPGYSGDGGPATSAQLRGPWGLFMDGAGNLYIAEHSFNSVIRKVDTSGIIHTVAGVGGPGYGGDGGPATEAPLYTPTAVVVDSNHELFIADNGNYRVRKVDAAGIITTFAGTGFFGCTGDGGDATSADIGTPNGLLISGASLLFSAPSCNIRAVDLVTNTISTVAGAPYGYGFNGDGQPALSTDFAAPEGLFFDLTGNLMIVDANNDRIRKINSKKQTVSTIAGGYIGDGVAGTKANLNFTWFIRLDAAGELHITDSGDHRIRKLDSAGNITTVAGNGFSGYTGDGGPATAASLFYPLAAAADNSGNLYIADQDGAVLRKVDAAGIITTLENPGGFALFTGLSVDAAGNLYAVKADDCVVWKITPDAVVTIVAGVERSCGYNGDGIPATQAELGFPNSVSVDAKGNLLIADYGNFRIRKVNKAGIISTVAGNGGCCYSGDGGPATEAMINPLDVMPDTKGNFYIADYTNNRIRKVNRSGVIQTLAGTGTLGYNGEGLPPKKTNVGYALSVAVSPTGVVYFVDGFEPRVRKIQ